MYKFFKRLLDIIISLLAIIILSPLLLPVIIILLLTGEHYVFYKQKRIGYNNKPFKIWKFATMLKNSPNIGTGSITLKNDPRVFPFGRFLRKTKINELPQVFNVLLGDMSIVGPRPLMEVDFLRYPEEMQKTIYKSKPGITGIGSIILRDQETLRSKFQKDGIENFENSLAPFKGELEMWYQKNASFCIDLKIVFLTAWVIVFPKNNLTYKLLSNLPPTPPEFILT
ncbi:MAG TPA: sugar transferase [Salinivirgaceae bacterium]|nr:sugar transferase [Salinivirgaceae bacterium]